MSDFGHFYELEVENAFHDDQSIEVERLLIYKAGKPRIQLKNDPGIDEVVGITLDGVRYWFYGIGEARTEDASESRMTNVLEFKPLHPRGDLYINELYMLIDSQGIPGQGGGVVYEFWFLGAHLPNGGWHLVRDIYPLDADDSNTRFSARAENIIFHMLDIRRKELAGRKSRYSELSDFLVSKFNVRPRKRR